MPARRDPCPEPAGIIETCSSRCRTLPAVAIPTNGAKNDMKHNHASCTPAPARLALAIATGLGLALLHQEVAAGSPRNDAEKTIAQAFDAAGRQSSSQAASPLDFLPTYRPTEGEPAAATRSSRTAAGATDHEESGVAGNPASWVTEEFAVDWGLNAIGAQHAYARGLTGAGIRLGMVDTGTMSTHPEFAGAGRLHPVDSRVDFDDSTYWESHGGTGRLLFGDHGTHVAGTIAASRDGSGMHGVAFGADLYAASGYALDQTTRLIGQGTDEDFGILGEVNKYIADFNAGAQLPPADQLAPLTREELLGLLPSQWGATPFDPGLVANAFDQMAGQGVRVINNSWGGTPDLGATFDDIARAFEEGRENNQPMYDSVLRAARDHDVLFVFAAGNESGTGNDAGTLTHADVEAALPAFIPELEDHWVAVVAVDANGDRADFSNICGNTANWCIAAPGTTIMSIGFDPGQYEERLNSVVLALANATKEGFTTGSVYERLEAYRADIVGKLADQTLDASMREYLESVRQDLLGVGIDITSGNAFNGSLGAMTVVADNPIYKDMDGTSMASPHVTGALGLLFERFPYLTATQVRDVMFTTATDLGDEGVDEIYGWGLVNLGRAVDGPGQLLGDTVVHMDRAAGGIKVWDGDAWDDWRNDISGDGRLFKDGAGWLRLSGNNTFAGASVNAGTLEFDGDSALAGDVQVVGGTFILNGSLQGSDLQVYRNGHVIIDGILAGGNTWTGGWLGGNGSLGNTTVAGTIAPGDGFMPAIGTLRVAGDYLQAAGSSYAVDLLADGASDRIEVSGTATLQGGTVVPLRLLGNQYVPGQNYRILSAAGGVSGAFAGLDTTAWDMPFLALDLMYSPLAVNLVVSRGASFASVAGTWNQTSTASALDGLADTSALLLPMLQLGTGQALDAFDQLSGELYPGLRSVLVESGRMPREAALQRARADTNGFSAQGRDGLNHGVWADVYRSGGHVGGDGNAHRIEHSSRAVLAGYDHHFDAGWLIGALVGSGRTDFDLSLRSHKGRADTRHIGVYGGGAWNGFGLRAGLVHARHEIDTQRQITIPGFDDQTRARFDGHTRQAVIEVGYHFNHHAWELEPFLQYANVRVKHDPINEAGGDAALSVSGTSSKVNLGTAGLRFSANLRGSRQEQTWLSLRGKLGYRHASGDRMPSTDPAFVDGGPFNVRGAPIADGSILVEAGIAARLAASTVLELGYSGQLADEARDHGANMQLSWQF